MRKSYIIGAIIILAVLVLGLVYASRLKSTSAPTAEMSATLPDGKSELPKPVVAEFPVGYGTVTKVSGNDISFNLQPLYNPAADLEAGEITFTTSSKTKITSVNYAKVVDNGPETKTISVKDIKVGDSVSVSASSDVAIKNGFEASSVVVTPK